MGGATPLSAVVLLVAKGVVVLPKIFNKQTERGWRGVLNVPTEHKHSHSA